MLKTYGLIRPAVQAGWSPAGSSGAASLQAVSGTERLVSQLMQTQTASRWVWYVTRIRPTRQMGQNGTMKQGSGVLALATCGDDNIAPSLNPSRIRPAPDLSARC